MVAQPKRSAEVDTVFSEKDEESIVVGDPSGFGWLTFKFRLRD